MKLPRISLLTLLIVLSLTNGLFATTVIPPSFNQLVRDAELIFEGTVSTTESQWLGAGTDRVIVTYVTFEVRDPIKGAPGKRYTIRMLGGTIDGETQEVADAPRFRAGDRDIVFIENNGSQFIPLVGIMHGRFRVQKDSADRDVVTKDNGRVVSDVSKLGNDEAGAVSGRALAVNEFKAAIRQKLLELGLAR